MNMSQPLAHSSDLEDEEGDVYEAALEEAELPYLARLLHEDEVEDDDDDSDYHDEGVDEEDDDEFHGGRRSLNAFEKHGC